MKTTKMVIGLFVVGISISCNSSKTKDAKVQEKVVVSKYTEKLSKTNATLIMVDYLTGFDPGLKTIGRNLYYHNVTALAKIGNIFKLPTIVLGDEGGFRGKFYPLIDKYLPNAPKLARKDPSAWTEKSVRDFIEKTNRKKIIIAGISLDNCTLQTSLDLLKNGYDVYVVVDASGTDEVLVEQAAMTRLTQAGAVMVTWVSIASEIMEVWDTPEGAEVGKLYQEHSAWSGPLKTIER